MNAPVEQGDGSGPAGSATIAAAGVWSAPAAAPSRLADYAELVKLRLSVLVLLVTAAGFCMAAQSPLDLAALGHALFGTALVAFGANAMNQVIERRHDRRMARTANRPVAAGRIAPQEAGAIALTSAASGLVYLAVLCNALTAILALFTITLYLGAYTPLKRVTPLNTLVGALPGAIPPMIGYAAAAGTLRTPAWLLFAILFCWQLPHFFSIAWMYREDYVRGGYRMLSSVDSTGRALGLWTVSTLAALVFVSLLPTALGVAGPTYAICATALGAAFLWAGGRLAGSPSRDTARLTLLASLAYLPLLMMVLLLDRIS